MSKYRRLYLPGHSYFFTVVTAKRKPLFANAENVELIKSSFRYALSRKLFRMEAICILPDHLHGIWTIEDDTDFSARWQMIKTHFTRKYHYLHPGMKQVVVWQPRFWEHVIRDQSDFDKHLDYLHFNPVKHGLVKSVNDWPYSSFNKYLANGYYDSGWGATEPASVVGLCYE